MGWLPLWLLWIIVIAAAALSPFAAMLILFLSFELLWDATDAIGAPAALSLCIGIAAGLALGKLRPRQPQTSAT